MSTTQISYKNSRVAAEASSSTESLEVQTGNAKNAAEQQDEAIAQRAQKRREKREQNHALAEEHNKTVCSAFL